MNLSSPDLDSVLGHFELNSQLNYLGTYPLDEIPSITEVCTSLENALVERACPLTGFIVNTDEFKDPGMHWFALAVVKSTGGQLRRQQHYDILLIDPLGLEGLLLSELKPLNIWCKEALSRVGGGGELLQTLSYQVQPLHSNLCGAYCAYILYHLKLYNWHLGDLTRGEFLPPHAISSGGGLSENDQRVAAWWYKRREAIV